MATDNKTISLITRSKPISTLVLLCSDLEDLDSGLDITELATWTNGLQEGVNMAFMKDLCHDPESISGSVRECDAQRLVLGLCSQALPSLELQAQMRIVGLDPLGIQIVDLGNCCGGDTSSTMANGLARVVLEAAVARARAFPGSQPENLKAVLPPPQQKVSRRALFTLPPVVYAATPSINRGLCAASEGCELCVSACPHDALEGNGDEILVNRSQCQSCGVCVSVCPGRAVELPGSSPEELEAQLSSLLKGRDCLPEKAVAFVCGNVTAAPGPGWLPVKVPCLSMVSVGVILETLDQGADAVALLSCGQNCRQGLADAVGGRMDFCGRLLELLGDPVGRDRVRLIVERETESVTPAPSLPSLPGEVESIPPIIFGKDVASRAVSNLAKRFAVKDLTLEHPHSPLGLVKVDDEACTVCGACASSCPTSALSYDRRDNEVALSFEPALCTACELCVAMCPEVSRDAISLARITDCARLSQGRVTIRSDKETICESCGSPVAPLAMLRRIESMLGEEDAAIAGEVSRFCLSCRGSSGDGAAGNLAED